MFCSLSRKKPRHTKQSVTRKTSHTGANDVEQTMWLTLLTVVELVKLTGFRLTLAKDQVVSDVSVGIVGRFPLEDDLGRGVG